MCIWGTHLGAFDRAWAARAWDHGTGLSTAETVGGVGEVLTGRRCGDSLIKLLCPGWCLCIGWDLTGADSLLGVTLEQQPG